MNMPFYAGFERINENNKTLELIDCCVFDVIYENGQIKFLAYNKDENINGYYPVERFRNYSVQTTKSSLRWFMEEQHYHLERIRDAIKQSNGNSKTMFISGLAIGISISSILINLLTIL